MAGMTFHDHEPKDLLLVKWQYSSNIFSDSVNSYQNHNCIFFFRNGQTDWKSYMEIQGIPNSQNNWKRKTKLKDSHCSISQTTKLQ